MKKRSCLTFLQFNPILDWIIFFFCRIREPKKKKSPIEEQWEKYASFGLTSVEQETHEKYFYGSEHWNYFTNDEDLGPVILSLKQETINGRDQFR